MSAVKTHNVSGAGRGTARARDGAGADPRRLEKARAIFVSLSKYISARTIYAGKSPIVGKFAAAFEQALQAFFQDEKELSLSVEQYQIKWRGETVYDNREKKESLAFLLYKDGVGEITIQAAVKPAELEKFVDLIRSEICCPSAHIDIVSKLWQSEFTNISYRVFDESAEGSPGAGRGAGNESHEQRLRAGDHPDPASVDRGGRGNSDFVVPVTESLGKHLYKVIERKHPGAGAPEKERHLQRLLESHFTLRAEELSSRQEEFSALDERDKLLWLLNTMLDFTRTGADATAARDILDIIKRLVRSMAQEAHIPSLIALLDVRKKLSADAATAAEFVSLPKQIEDELTNTEFLLGLGKQAGRSRNDAREILEYFRLVGDTAVRGLREILSASSDTSIHERTCEILFEIARDYIMPIIEDLNLDNPLEALDAVHLLRRRGGDEVSEIVGKLLSSPDAQVRACTIEYLAGIGNDEAAQLLCRLLDDVDMGVRLHTFAAVEQLEHPSIIVRVTSMCFEEDIATKSMDELERMFRALGKLAGTSVLDRIRRMASARSLFSIGGARSRRSKLLAVTALRYIPGQGALDTLEKLATDGDNLVRSKAQHVLNLLDEQEQETGRSKTPVSAGGGE